jgi:hypothetical protein
MGAAKHPKPKLQYRFEQEGREVREGLRQRTLFPLFPTFLFKTV